MNTTGRTANDILKEKHLIFGHRAASQWLEDRGYLLSTKSLLNMASLGTGPVFYKWEQRVVYRAKDLQEWAEGRWGRGGGT